MTSEIQQINRSSWKTRKIFNNAIYHPAIMQWMILFNTKWKPNTATSFHLREKQQINFCLTKRSTELDIELTENGGGGRRRWGPIQCTPLQVTTTTSERSWFGLCPSVLPANKLGYVWAPALFLVLFLALDTRSRFCPWHWHWLLVSHMPDLTAVKTRPLFTCQMKWKKLGGPTSGSRRNLTGNRRPAAKESEWHFNQIFSAHWENTINELHSFKIEIT